MKTLMIMGGIMLAAVATSCSTTRTMTADELSGEWDITTVQDKAISTQGENAPYLAFDLVNSRLFGSVGCNRIMGNVAVDESGTIDMSGIAATKMMCPDADLEMSILTALNQVQRYGADKEGDLVLMDGHNRKMLALTRRADVISPASLVGVWKVNMLGDLDLSVNQGERAFTITFDSDGTFSMTTGCNNVGGNYGGRYVDITFSNLMSTRMMCPDMEVETVASQLLPTVTAFSALGDGTTYGFYDAANNLVMSIGKME